MAASALAFGSTSADEGGPREGHFHAPDVPPLAAALAADESTTVPNSYQTSEYMIGSVAVGLILPESDGTIDANLSDWTPEQRRRVLDEVTEGLAWWSQQAPETRLTFSIDDHATNPIPTGYEPIVHPQSDEGLWIKDTLARLGYDNGSQWTRVRRYVDDLRATRGADWAFAIFVVNSAGDADAAFADQYFAYAYVGGPFLVMTYDNANYGIHNMDAVTAHETGHIFRALDQYVSANVACTARSGYLGVETQNSQQPGCASDVPSIMRGGVAPYAANAVDHYARGQIGWRDSDNDGIFDPVDTLPTLTVDTAVRSAQVWTYTGRSVDTAFPSPFQPDVAINDVSVEYSLDGGVWEKAMPTDGHFDSPDEPFTLTFQLDSTGNHHVTLRARNSVGNVSDPASVVAVVPDPIDGGLDTWLAPSAPELSGSGWSAHGIASSYNADGTPGRPIARVEYRVDSGAWEVAQPQDGAFDSSAERFVIPVWRSGTRFLEARAVDASGKVEQNVAGMWIDAGYIAFIPIAQK